MVNFRVMGVWNAGTPYSRFNMVEMDGRSFIARVDTPAGVGPWNAKHWCGLARGKRLVSIVFREATENCERFTLNYSDGSAGHLQVDFPSGGPGLASVIKDSASGSLVTLKDGAEGAPLAALSVAIEPVQSGSGDPSPENVRPITGREAVRVYRTGKNLFDGNTELYEPHLTTTAERLNIYKETGRFCSGYYTTDWMRNDQYLTAVIPVKASVSYVFSNTADTMSRVIFIDENANIITESSSWIRTYVHTALENEKYAMVGVKISASDSFQVEIGTAVSDCEAGSAQTVEVSLSSAGMVYGGTLDVTNGVLTVDRKKLILQPNMGWSKSSAYPGGYFCAAGSRGLKDYTAFLCSHAKYAASLSEYVRGTCFCDRSLNFRLLGEDSTLQDWQDYLTNNEVSIVGFLAGPVTYQLTGKQVTTLLGLNQLWADTGDVSLSYRADTKLYIDRKAAELQALVLEQ